MRILLQEYTVTKDPSKKEPFSLEINDNQIIYNGRMIHNDLLIRKVKEVLEENKEKILRLKDIKHYNYKGGRQQLLQIYEPSFSDKNMMFSGNTDNQEIATFYKDFMNRLIMILHM